LHTVDEAIRSRLHMVPFNVTFPPEQRDPNLPEKLRAEWPGILQWAIEGCLEWQRIGLADPAAVLTKTQEYFTREDPFSEWIQDCCVIEKSEWTSIADLYRGYETYTRSAGEKTESKRELTDRLASQGFIRERAGKACIRGFRGIGLSPVSPQEEEEIVL
jgi:putative DNA primase/helicase